MDPQTKSEVKDRDSDISVSSSHPLGVDLILKYFRLISSAVGNPSTIDRFWNTFSLSQQLSVLQSQTDFGILSVYLNNWQSFNHRPILEYFQFISTIDNPSIIDSILEYTWLSLKQIYQYVCAIAILCQKLFCTWHRQDFAPPPIQAVNGPDPPRSRAGPVIDRTLNGGWQHNPGVRRFINAERLELTRFKFVSNPSQDANVYLN
jgi:hypothetical protein